MRILQLVKTSVGATWALRQMRELVKLGVDVHAALPPGPLVPRYREAGVTVHEVEVAISPRSPAATALRLKALRSLVLRVKPELVHSHFVATTVASRLALRGLGNVALVFQVPGPLHLEHRFFRTSEIALADRNDYWIASCRWTQDRYVRSGIAPERVFLSYYGMDLPAGAPAERGALRRELGVAEDTPLLGMVAYMYAPKRYIGQTRGLKGHEDLIDASALLAREFPTHRVVFAGGAWAGATGYEAQVQRYARRKLGDRAVFLGTRSDVPAVYADLDVAVHPSHSENLGGASESLLAAVPTVATRVGGFPDIVIEGRTGHLVPPKDPPALAEGIARMLRDPAQARRLAKEGQRHVREVMDIRRNAREVADVYERILEARR